MTRKLIYAYLICLPLTSALAITQIVSVCFILLLILSLLYFYELYLNRSKLYLSNTDILVLLFWSTALLSFILNSGDYISHKPINHLFAYTYVIIGNYFLLKNIVFNQILKERLTLDKVAFYIGIGVLITSVFGLFEFFAKNVFSFDLDNYIPRAAVVEYEPLAVSFIRLRSFVEESGHLAFYYELLAPLGLYGLSKNKMLFLLTLITTASCFLLTFSTAGWIILCILASSIAIKYLLKQISHFNIYTTYRINLKQILLLVLVIALCTFGLFQFYASIGSEIIENIVFGKITNSGSANDRTLRASYGHLAFLSGNFFNILLGYGPAAYDTLRLENATIILYQTFLLETGLIGLLLFLAFCGSVLYKLSHIKDNTIRSIFMCSMLGGLLHYIFIANYWYPWFWVLIIIGEAFNQEKTIS